MHRIKPWLPSLLGFLTLIAVCIPTQAQIPGLELHITFDDQANPGLDSSGNNRHAEPDFDEIAEWLDDAERGGVMQYLGGSMGGFWRTEIPELPGEFTIAMWAYRDSELAGNPDGGENDGLFLIQDGGDIPTEDGTGKIIGGWVLKADSAVWGRLHEDDLTQNNLPRSTYFMEDDEWIHLAYRGDGSTFEILVNGEVGVGPDVGYGGTIAPHDTLFIGKQGTESWGGRLDDFRVYNRALTDDEIARIVAGQEDRTTLMAGDADMDLDFDQLDLVRVQVAGKYLSGSPATWGDGDWDGAPGGEPGSPPAGDGMFNQLDIIAALNGGVYLTGPYGAVSGAGVAGDAQTSVGYNVVSGEVWVDAPAGVELTSINIDSAAGIFTGSAAENLGGSFDNDADTNIFKATFGGSFGAISFGNVAQTGLSQEFVMNDLTVVGSLSGGGSLGEVDLIYVPEPTSLITIFMGTLLLVSRCRRR